MSKAMEGWLLKLDVMRTGVIKREFDAKMFGDSAGSSADCALNKVNEQSK
jgi:hypothetical protein